MIGELLKPLVNITWLWSLRTNTEGNERELKLVLLKLLQVQQYI